LSCHHSITFCTTSSCQPNNLCTVVLKLFADIIPSFLCNLHQVVLYILFLFLYAMLFCHHCIFVMFFFVLSTSLCYSNFFFYLFLWALLIDHHFVFFMFIFIIFRLLTNRVSFSLKFYIDFATCLSQYVKGFSEQNNGKLSREWTHKRAIIAHVLVFLCRVLKLKFCFQEDLNI
jgi:hypothetical protein